MKVLLLFPRINDLAESFKEGASKIGFEVLHYDYDTEILSFYKKIHGNKNKLPFGLRFKWQEYFFTKISSMQLKVFNEFQPDLVFVYNSMLNPDTISQMKRSAKLCFLLGDSPFYTPQNEFYIQGLMSADLILCPDSYWEKQLKGMGFDNVRYFLIGCDKNTYYKKQVSIKDQQQWGSDLVFIGASYNTVTGFKRAMFLNQFKNLDIKIYTGHGFQRWYRYFPDLKEKVIHPQQRLTDDQLNTILNCCRIYPVDANPGIINGVHLRIFECIASGILPLAEYRKDVVNIFGKAGLPIITNYKMASSMAEYYLKNEKEGHDIIESLQALVRKAYAPEIAVQNLVNLVRK